MKPRSTAALLALVATVSALPTHAADPDALKRQTVQIRVNREGAETEYGSGVVLCQQKDGLAYILTAHHVLYGKSQTGGLKLSRRDVKNTEIRFFKDLAPAILEDRDKGEDRITPFPVPAKDLVLMVVTVLDQIPTAAPGKLPSEADLAARASHDFPATAVGYAQRSAQGWIERTGAMLRRDPPFLMHSAQIEEGFSGGPLFDESGALVGLNVQFVSAAAGGEDTFGNREGRTLAIDEIMKSIDTWVPAGCVERTTEDTSESEAFDSYKLAMREIGLRRWGKAVPLLKEALEKKPREGGRVHLQGMRYTEYLPHYHLGLAYYKLDLHRDAYRELAISETQSAVQEDKRYRKLKKIKKAAYGKRNEGPAPAAL
jgi:hypothetical protein